MALRYFPNPELRRNPSKLERFMDNVRADHARRCRMCGGPRRFSYVAGGYVCVEPCSMLTAHAAAR